MLVIVCSFLAKELQRISYFPENFECDLEGDVRLWTSAKRQNNDCKKPFVWTPFLGRSLKMSYTKWDIGHPDCSGGREKCIYLKHLNGGVFNDVPCEDSYCSLCEVDKSD